MYLRSWECVVQANGMRVFFLLVSLDQWFRLGWTGLDWAGLDWAGLDWAGLLYLKENIEMSF